MPEIGGGYVAEEKLVTVSRESFDRLMIYAKLYACFLQAYSQHAREHGLEDAEYWFADQIDSVEETISTAETEARF